MDRILKFRHEDEDFFIDLGNIKYVNTSEYGNCVNIYFLKGFEYVVNPNSGKCELIEPNIQLSFNNDTKKHNFANNISQKWKEYLDGNINDKK